MKYGITVIVDVYDEENDTVSSEEEKIELDILFDSREKLDEALEQLENTWQVD